MHESAEYDDTLKDLDEGVRMILDFVKEMWNADMASAFSTQFFVTSYVLTE